MQILGVAALLAAVAPVAMAGGQMIAAFMVGKNIPKACGVACATMGAVVLGAWLAYRFALPLQAQMGALATALACAALLAPPWGAYLLGKKWLEAAP